MGTPIQYTAPQIVTPEMVFIHFPLSNGNRLELRLDRRMIDGDFQRVKQMLDLMRESIVDDTTKEPTSVEE